MDDPTAHQPGDLLQEQLELDDGKIVSVILSPVNLGDQFLGTVSVFRDITREVEVDRMKSEFVATVSHELRTPMTSIKGYADLLLLGAAGQVSEQQQRFLATIKTNADRLSVLVNELLDISRIDRGVVKLNFQPTDVVEIVEAGMSHIRARVQNESKDLKVDSAVEPDVPLVNGDFDKIVQILNNLLDNAFNYTRPGGSIHVHAKVDGESVIFSVADTGVGIAPENQARVFERFFRGEDNQLVMETSGTGLGLSIVKEYVKMHEGQIWLESEVGKGTTVFVRLPAITRTRA
jgi:signal transduction histidine kinase